MVRANGGAPPSVWPSLRQRTAALLRDIYAELITEGAARALSRLPPPASEAVGDAAGCRDEAGESPVLPEMGAASSAALWTLSVLVAGVGSMESRLSSDSLPCRTVREATPLELRANAGTLGRDYLPSAYDPWLGPRSAGVIRLRYGFDARRLSQRPGAGACEYTPVGLDGQTEAWVRGCLAKPAAASRLAVWRALKRRLYHYDAGVLAFHAFPRNYLLSPAHWEELLAGRPNGGLAAALDVGAGDGSLCSPYARLFGSVTVTELTSPLVWRLKATPTQGASLQAVATAELTPRALGREQFDVAFCLNVLDRCKDPVRMVEQLHALLPPGGWLVVAVVLPWLQSDAVARGSHQRRARVGGGDFEAAAASLLDSLLLPAGFEALRLVRAPYLCAGDRNSPVAVLDSAVVLLRKAGPGADGAAAATREATQARQASAEAKRATPPPARPTAQSAHPHVDETRCSECGVLEGFRQGSAGPARK